jgi:hypothetical protein
MANVKDFANRQTSQNYKPLIFGKHKNLQQQTLA